MNWSSFSVMSPSAATREFIFLQRDLKLQAVSKIKMSEVRQKNENVKMKRKMHGEKSENTLKFSGK